MYFEYNIKILMRNHLENQSLDVNQSQSHNSNHTFDLVTSNNNKSFQHGHWTKQEQIYYYQYIKQNFQEIRDPINKKVTRVFKALAQKMKTRSPRQVKSHHQKMIEKYRTLNEIVIALQKKFFRQKRRTKEIQKQIKLNIQQNDNQFNLQMTATADSQKESILLIQNNQDEIVQIPIRQDFSNFENLITDFFKF